MSKNAFVSGVHIDNFGSMKRMGVDSLGPGLNVVYGSNETGKSSTSRFITDCLFGWLPTRSDPIVTKGTKRGYLTFKGDDGEWKLIRDGKETSVEVIDGLLWDDAFEDVRGNVTRDSYESVFSFNAQQLDEVRGTNDTLMAQLSSASSGTRIPPIQLAGKLSDRCKHLRTSAADNPDGLKNIRDRMHNLDLEIEELASKSDELESEALELSNRRRDLEDLRNRKEKLAARGRDIASDLSALEQKRGERKDLQAQYKQTQSEIADIDGRAEEIALTPEEKTCVENSSRIKGAAALAGELNDALVNLESQSGRVDEAERELAQHKDYGALVNPTVKANIERASEQLASAQTSYDNAHTRYVECESKAAAARKVLEDLSPTEEEKKKHPAAAIVLAALLCLAGIAQAVFALIGMNAGSGNSLVLIVSAVVCLIAGILVLVLWPKGRGHASPEEIEAQRKRLAELEHDSESTRVIDADREKKLADLRSRIKEFLEHYGLPSDSLDAARKAFDEQLAYDDCLKKLDGEKRRLASCQATVDKVQSQIADLLGYLEIDPMPRGRTLKETADKQKACLDEASRKMEENQRDAAERDRKVRQLAGTQKSLATCESLFDTLFSRYGIDASGSSATDESLDALRSSIEDRQLECRQEQAQVETDFEETSKRIGEIGGHLDVARGDTSLEQAELNRAGLESRQLEVAQEYLSCALALELVNRSIQKWEVERQPLVYKIAGEMLSEMTMGHWVRVVFDGDTVRVANREGETEEPALLSTGARQQLYLAVRIALLMTSPEISPSLPVVTDDILVNFDEYRRAGAAKALARLAETRQVIIFTCHREIQDLFRQAVPGVNVLEI